MAYGGNNTSGPIDVATAVKGDNSNLDFESETFVSFQSNGNTDDILAAGDNISPTVRGGGQGGNPPAVFTKQAESRYSDLGVGSSLRARDGKDFGDLVASGGVRRLTPRECERLQGFPDNYTLVQHRGRSAADGPRYKALGNSFPVPVVRWIGKRIEQWMTKN